MLSTNFFKKILFIIAIVQFGRFDLGAIEVNENTRFSIKDVTGTLVVENQPPANQDEPPALRVSGVSGKLALNHTITVEVKNLYNYLKITKKDFKKISLYLDWRKIKGIEPRLIDQEDKLEFDLKRTEENKLDWNALLGKPLSDKKGFKKDVFVSIGFEDEKPIPHATSQLQLINPMGFYAFLVFFVIALWSFVWLARNTAIIRDPDPVNILEFKNFSLARTQMAFWFFMATISYVFIFLITYEINSIPQSVYILLGISSVTTAGSIAVDVNKEAKVDEGLQEQKKKEADNVNTLIEKIKKAPQMEKEKLETSLKEGLEKLKALGYSTEKSKFLTDLLSDGNGVNFHRFQMIVWTLILGVVFIVTIYNSLTMPEFNDNLLILMGISGGTYVGLKIPEK